MNIMPDLNPLGLCGLQGTYTRKNAYGFGPLSFDWWISINSIGECLLYTNDALTDCYTSDNAISYDSIADALHEVRRIIAAAAS